MLAREADFCHELPRLAVGVWIVSFSFTLLLVSGFQQYAQQDACRLRGQLWRLIWQFDVEASVLGLIRVHAHSMSETP